MRPTDATRVAIARECNANNRQKKNAHLDLEVATVAAIATPSATHVPAQCGVLPLLVLLFQDPAVHGFEGLAELVAGVTLVLVVEVDVKLALLPSSCGSVLVLVFRGMGEGVLDLVGRGRRLLGRFPARAVSRRVGVDGKVPARLELLLEVRHLLKVANVYLARSVQQKLTRQYLWMDVCGSAMMGCGGGDEGEGGLDGHLVVPMKNSSGSSGKNSPRFRVDSPTGGTEGLVSSEGQNKSQSRKSN